MNASLNAQDSSVVLSPQEETRFGELCAMAFNFARTDDRANLEIMLDAGLNVDLCTHKDDSLLMLASYNNAPNCVDLLLSRGANVNLVNDRGHSILAGACFKGYENIAKKLVEAGANIDSNGLMNPYSCAIMFGHANLAQFLLSKSKKSFLKRISLKILKIFKK